jgi:20S proteasome subunit alpha 4
MDREETIKLTVKSLLEVVQTGAKNIEIAIMEPFKEMEVHSSPPPAPSRCIH